MSEEASRKRKAEKYLKEQKRQVELQRYKEVFPAELEDMVDCLLHAGEDFFEVHAQVILFLRDHVTCRRSYSSRYLLHLAGVAVLNFTCQVSVQTYSARKRPNLHARDYEQSNMSLTQWELT